MLNRGYSERKKKWKTAEGKAYFVKTPEQGFLVLLPEIRASG